MPSTVSSPPEESVQANGQPSASGFITAMELCHQRKRVVRISTGSKQFDSILGG